MIKNISNDDERFNALIEKWMQGDFRQADERDLQSLTENDAFRKEAWEGFVNATEEEHDQSLARLRQRLQKQQPTQPVPLRPLALGRRLMAAAAAILLVAMAGYWWLWPRRDFSQDKDIVQQQSPVSPTVRDETPEDAVVQITQKKVSPAIPQVSPPPAGSPRHTPSAVADKATGTATDAEAVASSKAEEQMEAAESDTEEKAVVEQLKESPVATPLPPAASMPVRPGSENAKMPAAKRAKQHRTEDRADMDSIRVAMHNTASLSNSMPTGGWDEWEAYIRQNARLTTEARNKNISGKVVVQFSVSPSGDPVNAVFLTRLGAGCDEEALRLIRSWEWIAGRNPVVRVEIPFVR